MTFNGSAPTRNVAIFIDMENLFGGYSKDVTWLPIGKIVREIETVIHEHKVGALTASVRAYANWGRSDMAAYKRELLENGVEPVQVFSFNLDVKNAADIELVVDALELAADAPHVSVFVIVSGDGGYVPLIRRLHVLGKFVIVVTTSHHNTGTVNKILKKVADYFHVVEVIDSTPRGAVAEPQLSVGAIQNFQESTTTSQRKNRRKPSLQEYKETTLKLIKENPAVLIDGKVNGQRLKVLLHKRWPSCDYSDFGFPTLGSFIEKKCGLVMHRPQSTYAPTAPQANHNDILVAKDLPSYRNALRRIFEPSQPTAERVKASAGTGLPLKQIETTLGTFIQGRSYEDVGYPDLRTALRHALDPAKMRVREDADGDYIVAAEWADGNTYPPFGADDLNDPDLVRAVLGAQEPRISYPAPTVLSDVIQILTETYRPMEVAELIDFVADRLPDTLAEDIRQALGLLWEVGVLVGSSEDTRLTLGFESADEGMKRVVADAQRRAQEIGWKIETESIEYIIY